MSTQVDRARLPNWVREEKLLRAREFQSINWFAEERPVTVAATQLTTVGDVLLIEDDVSIAEMYAFDLSSSGYSVRIVTSGESALSDVVPAGHISAIVLDLDLPSMSGLATLDELRHREVTAHVPVIVLSNKDIDFDEVARHGADECHRKFMTTPRQLVGYIERAVGRAA